MCTAEKSQIRIYSTSTYMKMSMWQLTTLMGMLCVCLLFDVFLSSFLFPFNGFQLPYVCDTDNAKAGIKWIGKEKCKYFIKSCRRLLRVAGENGTHIYGPTICCFFVNSWINDFFFENILIIFPYNKCLVHGAETNEIHRNWLAFLDWFSKEKSEIFSYKLL